MQLSEYQSRCQCSDASQAPHPIIFLLRRDDWQVRQPIRGQSPPAWCCSQPQSWGFLELCRFPSSHASSSSHEAAKYVLKVLVWSIRISTINICIMLASQIPERARGLWGLPGNHNNITPPPRTGAGRWGINHFYSADEFRHFEFVWYLENWIVFLNLQPWNKKF